MVVRRLISKLMGSIRDTSIAETDKAAPKREPLSIGDRWHYHTMRDRKGSIIWEGQYDLYPFWSYFAIPEELEGQSVIDIGTATGFFAFECEKRGASPVVATELPDVADWDTKTGYHYQALNIPKQNQKDFQQAADILKSKVKVHWGNINEPMHKVLGTFDWVIFGSLMTHLRDPMLALENVRALTKGRAIVISAYVPGEERTVLHWVRSGRPFDWWLPAKTLIPEMLRAVGFRRIEETGCFVLGHCNGHKYHQACWHAFP